MKPDVVDHPPPEGPSEAAPMQTPPPGARPRWSLGQTFAALRYPNYRLWFIGQLVSLVGTWMQTTAQGYLIFELTKSPAYLGYVGFAAGVPSWLFMLYGGVVADRVSRRNLLVVTQLVMMALAFILAVLAATGMVQPWHIIMLALALGTANAFDAPARVSFLLELVDREDLTNAVALNGTMFNSATAVGPAVAGLTYAWVGPAWCFALNGLSFVAVITALLLMKLKRRPALAIRGRTLDELKAGVKFVASSPTLRTLIAMAGLTSLFGMAFVTLLPAWAVDVLGGDATTNGLLQSARGVGALFAALFIASLGRFQFKGKLLTAGSFFYPILLLVFSFMDFLPLALLALVGAGWGLISMLNISNALVQTHVPDELRGRVVSIYTLTFFGLMPIGALLTGGLALYIGAPNTVRLGALAALAVAAFIYVRVPRVRALP
jgi:MFS family permease